MAKKLTKEEVNQRLKNNFEQKVELAGEYINKRTKFLLKCNECGYQWEALPTSTLYSDYKHKCPNCEHSYYVYGCELNCSRINNNKKCKFIEK